MAVPARYVDMRRQAPGLIDTRRVLMSLQPGGQSHQIPAAFFAAEHNCAFWNTVGHEAEGVPGMGIFRPRTHHARAWARWLLTGLGE